MNLDIKSLTQDIKSGKLASNETEPTEEKSEVKTTKTKKVKTTKPRKSTVKSQRTPAAVQHQATPAETGSTDWRELSFDDLLELANDSEYKCTDSIYIDEQIHTVLMKLKKATKLRTGKLVSLMLEHWITENLDTIKKSISDYERRNTQKSNKFLS